MLVRLHLQRLSAVGLSCLLELGARFLCMGVGIPATQAVATLAQGTPLRTQALQAFLQLLELLLRCFQPAIDRSVCPTVGAISLGQRVQLVCKLPICSSN